MRGNPPPNPPLITIIITDHHHNIPLISEIFNIGIKTNEINAKTGKAKLKRGKPYIKNLVYNVRWSNAYDNVEMQFKQNESDDEDTCELDH